MATAVVLYASTVLAALLGGLGDRPDRIGFLVLLTAVAVTGGAALAPLVIGHGQIEVRAALRPTRRSSSNGWASPPGGEPRVGMWRSALWRWRCP